MKNQTKKIAYASVLAALAAALKVLSDLPVGIQGRTLSFFSIPLIIAGYFCGPWFGLAAGFAADTVYALVPFTQGSFGSLFTITTMIWGLSGFLIKKIKLKPLIVKIAIVVIVTSFLETSLNTVFSYIYGYSKILSFVYSVKRIVELFIRVPIIIHLTNKLIIRLPDVQFETSEI